MVLITFVLFVVGLGSLVRSAALVSPTHGWFAFGMAMLALSLWPYLLSTLRGRG